MRKERKEYGTRREMKRRIFMIKLRLALRNG